MMPSPDMPPRRRRHRLAGAAVLALCVAGAALAQTGNPPEALEALERQLKTSQEQEAALTRQLTSGLQDETARREEKRAAAAELKQVRRRLVAAARELQGKEARLTALEDDLAALDAKGARMKARLETRLRQRRQVLGAILRIARFPPEAMSVLPEPPLHTVRGIMVFRSMEPDLRQEANRIRDDLAQLAALRTEKARLREATKTAKAELEIKQAALERLQEERTAIVARTHSELLASTERNKAIAAELQERAKDVGDLIELIARQKLQEAEAARRAAEAAQSASPEVTVAAAGTVAVPEPSGIQEFTGEMESLRPPVQGAIVRQYGAKDDFGATSKGLVIEGRAGAQVVAPFDGKVVFAGPFRGYGQILLIEHGGGYHTLLAGLGRIDGVPGQWLLAGEPVAVMGDTAAGRSKLYVEFRRDGRPINPRPYMAVAQNRTSE